MGFWSTAWKGARAADSAAMKVADPVLYKPTGRLLGALGRNPFVQRTVAGGVLGGLVFHRSSSAQDSDATAPALHWGTTALGIGMGALAGAGFPFLKKMVRGQYEVLQGSYAGHLSDELRAATKSYNKEAAQITKKFSGEERAKKLAGLTKPSADSKMLQLKAGLETYLRPQVTIPAGMLLGSAYASNHGEDPVRGMYLGGMAGAGLGVGYHGFRVYQKSGFAGRTVWGTAMIGGAGAAGIATADPEYGAVGTTVPDESGYETQMMYTGAGRRAQMMGASGDIVFGLQNMRHG